MLTGFPSSISFVVSSTTISPLPRYSSLSPYETIWTSALPSGESFNIEQPFTPVPLAVLSTMLRSTLLTRTASITGFEISYRSSYLIYFLSSAPSHQENNCVDHPTRRYSSLGAVSYTHLRAH